MKICVIFNPVACGEKARRFQQHLGALAAECALKPTVAAGGGRALAAEAVREGFETVVAAGGDGTLNEVLNGIGDVPDGFVRTRLGVLPLGTVNVFAKELNIPAQFEQAWSIIRRGQETIIDLPEAEFNLRGQPCRRFFAQMAGAGFDARAVELVNWEQKKRYGIFAYIVAAFKAMNGPMPQIVVTDGKESIAGELILIGNGRFYGGRYRIFPLADLRDGVLEVSVFPRVNWEALLRGGWGLLTDQLYASGHVKSLRAGSVNLYSATGVPFHVEGENVGYLPAKFSVGHLGLRVLVP